MSSVIRTVLICTALLFGVVATASAQNIDRMTFTTSFPFVAAGQTMPAGTYNVEPLGEAAIVLSDAQHRLVLMEVDSAAPADPMGRGATEVVFTKLENGTYALDQLWNESDQAGVAVAWTALRAPTEPNAATAIGRR